VLLTSQVCVIVSLTSQVCDTVYLTSQFVIQFT